MAEMSRKQILEAISGMSVIELADLVKDVEEAFGVSAAMTMSAAAPAAAAEKEEEKSEYKVTLESFGSEKIKCIKALRSVMPELNLSEAKKAVEEAPSVLSEAAPKDLASKIKEALEAAGAKVTLS